MKINATLAVVAILGISALALPARGQIAYSATSLGNLGTMPGSATDYTVFGNGDEFPNLTDYFGGTSAPTVLNDFTITSGADAFYTFPGYEDPPQYSTINGPTGSGETGVQTGVLVGILNSSNTPVGGPDMVEFTLGTPGSTFNFSDFDVYVMYGEGPGSAVSGGDSTLYATLLSPSGTVGSATVSVTDSNQYNGSNPATLSQATFEDFHITGGAAGDTLEIGSNYYLGGVSFAEAPEPSTYAMMFAGLLFLAFRMRFRSARLNG